MSEDRRLYEVIEEYFMRYLEINPIHATILGIHKFDSQMPRGDKEGIREQRKLVLDFRTALSDIGRDKLSFESRIDYDLAHNLIDLALFNLDELQLWRKYPFGGENIGDAIFPLFVRDFAPFTERFSSIVARLEKSPRYLRETMDCLEEPIEIYVDNALKSITNLPLFLDVIYRAGIEQISEDDPIITRAKHAIENLKSALIEYENWLEDVKAESKKDFAIGYDKFKRLLELRGIEYTPEEILKIGEDYLNKFKAELKELAKKIVPDGDVNKAREVIESEHPKTFEEAINEYKNAIERAKQFVAEKKLAPLPEGEVIKVVETPAYLRAVIPFAAYFPPAPFEENKVGIYLVTPPVKTEHLRRHNYYSISNTTVHEAYPGHHLQLSWSATIRNIIRLMINATEFIEGWAHYCEDMMKEHGYDATDKHRFILLLDAIWRAARIIVDIKLSTGKMSFDEAIEFLVKETGMDREAAEAEVRRYTYTPGYQLSYLLGKHMISELRREVREKLKDKYNEYKFHEIILTSGGMPYKYLRKLVFARMGIQ